MSSSYRVNQVFMNEYPPEAAIWCNEGGKYHIEAVNVDEDGNIKYKILKNPEIVLTTEEIKKNLIDSVQAYMDSELPLG